MRLNSKDSYLNTRVPTEIKTRIEAVADDQWMGTSDVVRLALKEYLTQHEDLFEAEPQYHHSPF
ncbi:hypothetical protein N9J96_09305 [Paracoccaceae bacterium]|jgi:antitoxin component of RelBE/YafQ-DinJ toxin-antitoxin module|nr:hypothetical protein [Paracoccaceae bacterium]|tara:strand:+ start:128 stop:319 length:192 start_codon:yes stop_codon:yes gene_type:complete